MEIAELYHHGILGMKWGIRRYQNPDGSLTAAGRKKYSVGDRRSETQRKAGQNENTTTYRFGDTSIQKGKNIAVAMLATGALAGVTYASLKRDKAGFRNIEKVIYRIEDTLFGSPFDAFDVHDFMK